MGHVGGVYLTSGLVTTNVFCAQIAQRPRCTATRCVTTLLGGVNTSAGGEVSVFTAVYMQRNTDHRVVEQGA